MTAVFCVSLVLLAVVYVVSAVHRPVRRDRRSVSFLGQVPCEKRTVQGRG